MGIARQNLFRKLVISVIFAAMFSCAFQLSPKAFAESRTDSRPLGYIWSTDMGNSLANRNHVSTLLDFRIPGVKFEEEPETDLMKQLSEGAEAALKKAQEESEKAAKEAKDEAELNSLLAEVNDPLEKSIKNLQSTFASGFKALLKPLPTDARRAIVDRVKEGTTAVGHIIEKFNNFLKGIGEWIANAAKAVKDFFVDTWENVKAKFAKWFS
ncbi:hypothetical protein [Streptomyces sp. NPDC059008]|uniref:hypothetical protein n=1 Tax=Streptomyces sp. NPDC059008 TaxID=3346693 RepID=UPI0036A861BF